MSTPHVNGVTPDDLPPDWREHYEERSAIMQEGCGSTRDEADRAALVDTLNVMERNGVVWRR